MEGGHHFQVLSEVDRDGSCWSKNTEARSGNTPNLSGNCSGCFAWWFAEGRRLGGRVVKIIRVARTHQTISTTHFSYAQR